MADLKPKSTWGRSLPMQEQDSNNIIELGTARIALALNKSLNNKTQLLPYLKVQIIKDFIHHLKTLTDKEVKDFEEIAYGKKTTKQGDVEGDKV